MPVADITNGTGVTHADGLSAATVVRNGKNDSAIDPAPFCLMSCSGTSISRSPLKENHSQSRAILYRDIDRPRPLNSIFARVVSKCVLLIKVLPFPPI